MGTRFRKSKKIAPGVKLNVGRKSVGISFGNKGGGISFNSRSGTRVRTSIPGTGISFSSKIGGGKKNSGCLLSILMIPFYMLYFICIWPFIALYRAIKKNKNHGKTANNVNQRGGGLSAPVMSSFEQQQVQSMLAQSKDCAKLVDSTVNPDVFFGRLHFMLDLTLTLQEFEKYKCFQGATPSELYQETTSNLNEIVDKFITRAYNKQTEKVSKLKTESGKLKSNKKFAVELKDAFDHADSFWIGHPEQAHYTGPLFTDENYSKVLSIYEEYASQP